MRCPGKKHGVVKGPASGVLEVKCDSRVCGAYPGVVVLHEWDVGTGQLNKTSVYNNPKREVRR